jgi:peroxiredoxin
LISADLQGEAAGKPIVLNTYDPIKQIRNPIARVAPAQGKSASLSFVFRHADLFRLDIPGRPSLYLVIDKGQKLISVEWAKNKPAKIKGSVDSVKLQAYEAFRKESNRRLIRPTYKAMSEASKMKDREKEVAAVEAYVRNNQLHRKELIAYTQREIGTSIALFWTSLRWTGDDEVARLERLVKAFAKKYPSLPMTRAMKSKVERFKRVALGVKFPNLQGISPDGKRLTLYQSLGKYTLVDFWASWCRPCLLQIPDLKKVYADFQTRGFEIFGYSVDTKKSKWSDAIKSFKMSWKHISDLKGWQSEWAAACNVTFVPFNFLLNEKGEIIAKNLHHKTLYKRLSRFFKK